MYLLGGGGTGDEVTVVYWAVTKSDCNNRQLPGCRLQHNSLYIAMYL